MINFQQVNNTSDTNFIEIYELYLSTFIPSERRNLDAFERIINQEPRFKCYALMREENFVGFFTFWVFDKFVFVEHFAISDKMRGQNIGSEVMLGFLSMVTLPVVLEVEMPKDANSVRRIKFYEKFAFKTISHAYAQPYYDGSGNLLPMLIMSNDSHFADKHFKQIKDTLYSEVYNYNSERD